MVERTESQEHLKRVSYKYECAFNLQVEMAFISVKTKVEVLCDALVSLVSTFFCCSCFFLDLKQMIKYFPQHILLVLIFEVMPS